jgi:hypothetical protein
VVPPCKFTRGFFKSNLEHGFHEVWAGARLGRVHFCKNLFGEANYAAPKISAGDREGDSRAYRPGKPHEAIAVSNIRRFISTDARDQRAFAISG